MAEVATAPKKRRSRKGARRREMVLDATLMVAAESGMDGATVGTVASACGTPKSLILYHFGSRDGLLEASVKHAIGRLDTSRRQHMAIAGGDPREQLMAWIRSLYATPEVVQAWCLMTQVTARTGPGAGLAMVADFEMDTRMQMSALLQRGNDEFVWQIPSAKSAAISVLALLDGLRLSLLRAGFEADLVAAEAHCRRAVLDHLVR